MQLGSPPTANLVRPPRGILIRMSSTVQIAMRFVRREPLWLYVLVCLPPFVGLINLYAGRFVVFKGHAAPVILMVGACLMALVLWVPFGAKGRWPGLAVTSLALVFIAWFTVGSRLYLEGSSIDAGVFVAPILLALTILKPITLRQAFMLAQAFAVTVVLCALIVILLGIVSELPSGFTNEGGSQRIGLLRDLGVEWRWSGPFLHSNLAGPLGGAVVLIGGSSGRSTRWWLISGGLLIMLLSQSRTGIMALIICGAVLLLMKLAIYKQEGVLVASIVSIGACLGILAYFLSNDRTMSARTHAWVDYWNLMLSSPLTGVESNGVRNYLSMNATVGQFAQPHAHNFLLDLGALWGAPVLLLSGVTLAVAVWLGVRAARTGIWLGVALAVFVTIVGIAERPFTWSHVSPLMIVFFLSVIVSGTASLESGRQTADAEGRNAQSRA